MRPRLTGLLAVAAAVFVVDASRAENLLSNPGFEEGIQFFGGDDRSDNWDAFFGGGTIFNNSSAGSTDIAPMPFSGAHNYGVGLQGGNNLFQGITQTQPIPGAEGLPVSFSFYAKRVGEFNIGAEFRLEFRDANGDVIGDQFALNTAIQDSLTAEYQFFSLTEIAPAGTEAVSTVIAIQTFSPSPGASAFGVLYVDDASLTVVPEPAAASLACLGLLAGAARTGGRRR